MSTLARIGIAVALLLVAPSAWAQPLHGHPQLAAYTSPSMWPTDSAQCHWTPANVDTAHPMIGHTHVDLTIPRYAELDAPIVVPFAVKLFHVEGHFAGFYMSLMRDIVWDETGSATQPVMNGDPHGVKVWTGHVTIDLRLESVWYARPRGWFVVLLDGITAFDNGDFTFTTLIEPFYSMLDPSADETWGLPFVRASCDIASSRTHTNFGANFVEYDDLLPVGPIDAPWRITAGTVGYGAAALGPATFEQRVDLDLHAGKPGTILESITQGGNNIVVPIVFDPAALGAGKHKMAVFRTQPDGAEEVSTLLVIDVTVGEAFPPPPPKPPAPPPPPPLPAKLLPAGNYTLCNAAGTCAALVIP